MPYDDIRELKDKPDFVICETERDGLTKGKRYRVIKKLKHPDYALAVYSIRNDRGKENNYFTQGFKEINR